MRLVGGDVAQHPPAGRIALLHAAAEHRQPQAAVACDQQLVDLAVRGRIARILGAPFVDRAVAADPHQATAMPQPQPPVAVLGDPQFQKGVV